MTEYYIKKKEKTQRLSLTKKKENELRTISRPRPNSIPIPLSHTWFLSSFRFEEGG